MLLDEETEAGDHVQKRPEEDEEEKVSISTWLYYYKGMMILLQKKEEEEKVCKSAWLQRVVKSAIPFTPLMA